MPKVFKSKSSSDVETKNAIMCCDTCGQFNGFCLKKLGKVTKTKKGEDNCIVANFMMAIKQKFAHNILTMHLL